MTDDLRTYTIYEKPRDYPHCWVVREFRITRDGPVPSDTVVIAPDLDKARSVIPPGLVCLARSPEDDPTIVETWL